MKTALITGACLNTGVAIVEKFASKGYNVVFTGRSSESVAEAEKKYKEKYPDVEITGYAIDSLNDDTSVNEKAVDELFEFLDSKGIFISALAIATLCCCPPDSSLGR